VDLDPGETTALPVSFEMTLRSTIALTEMNLPDLIAYSTNGVASKAVVDAVREAQRLRAEAQRYEMGVENLERERDGIGKEQARIRSNMNTIDRNSDLYARYMRTLTAQEDRLVAIEDDLQATRVELSKAEAAFTAYLRNLNVE
jgi:hypothetical protein